MTNRELKAIKARRRLEAIDTSRVPAIQAFRRPPPSATAKEAAEQLFNASPITTKESK